MNEAMSFTFTEYIDQFVYPHLVSLGETRTKEEIFYSMSLESMGDRLRRDERVFVMHNLDDFLLREGDGEVIEDLFNGRARLYPIGGHVGNIWHPDNRSFIENYFTNLK